MSSCSRCQIILNESTAYKKGNRLMSYCKSCFNKYCSERWKKRKTRVIEQMGGKCYDCSESYPAAVYDLHHLDPSQKEMVWDKMRLSSEERLQTELAKCVLLCSNCHRIRHSN